jgi:hypothetical protein
MSYALVLKIACDTSLNRIKLKYDKPSQIMKTTKIQILFVLFAFFALTSCNSIYQAAPPYTSVERMIQLKADMNVQSVSEILGIQPYDIYTIQETGGSILVYNYRVKDRKVKLPTELKKQEQFIHSEEYQKAGEPYYNLEHSKLYIFFKDGKMKSMMTDRGLEKSEYLMILDNHIRYISKEEYDNMKMFRLGVNPTYLVSKDTTSVIINLGMQEKSSLLGNVGSTKTMENKKGSVIGAVAGSLLAATSVVLLIALLSSY